MIYYLSGVCEILTRKNYDWRVMLLITPKTRRLTQRNLKMALFFYFYPNTKIESKTNPQFTSGKPNCLPQITKLCSLRDLSTSYYTFKKYIVLYQQDDN